MREFKLAGCALSSYFRSRDVSEAQPALHVPLVDDVSSCSAWFSLALLDAVSGNERTVLNTFFYAFTSIYSPFVERTGRPVIEKRKQDFPFGLAESSRPAPFAYAIQLCHALQAHLLLDNADGHCMLLYL
jgi:hypothetical protein